MIIFLLQKIKDRKSMHDLVNWFDRCMIGLRKGNKEKNAENTDWQGWNNVGRSLASRFHEEHGRGGKTLQKEPRRFKLP